jgi:hypothetical protein
MNYSVAMNDYAAQIQNKVDLKNSLEAVTDLRNGTTDKALRKAYNARLRDIRKELNKAG